MSEVGHVCYLQLQRLWNKENPKQRLGFLMYE